MPTDTIARVFYLVFLQASAGGMALMPLTPRKDIMGRYFRMMGAIFFASMLLGVWARAASGRDDDGPARARESLLLWIFLAAIAVYTITAIPDVRRLNVVAWMVAAVSGITLVVGGALGDPPWPGRLANLSPWHAVALVANFVISTVLLGAVTNGMLFGHWYLVEPHMSLAPLKKLILTFGLALVASVLLLITCALTLDTTRLLGETQVFHALLFWMRSLFGTASSLLLAVLTWRCLLLEPGQKPYHATRAATGMLYVAMLTAFSGELLGRFLMIATSVPV